MLEREAREAGLPLHWPRPSRHAAGLGCCRVGPAPSTARFPPVHRGLFAAHFVLGEDLEDPAVIDRHASESGVDLAALHSALADDSAVAAVREAEMIRRKNGVYGTPAWPVAKRLITGLLPAVEFERLAEGAGH